MQFNESVNMIMYTHDYDSWVNKLQIYKLIGKLKVEVKPDKNK